MNDALLEKERDQLANALERLADVQRELAEGQRSLMTGYHAFPCNCMHSMMLCNVPCKCVQRVLSLSPTTAYAVHSLLGHDVQCFPQQFTACTMHFLLGMMHYMHAH